MNLFLVRHPRPDIETGICYGATDVDLPDGWQREADEIKKRLRQAGGLNAARVYSSPLQRCARAAEYLFPEHSIVFDDRLREMHFGDWEMQPWSRIPRTLLDQWARNIVDFRPPGGESYRDLESRCSVFARGHLTNGDADTCIVTHGGVVRTLLTLLLDEGTGDKHVSMTARLSEPVDYGAVFTFIRRTPAEPFMPGG